MMGIVFVEIELLGNLRIGQIKTHEVRTKNPSATQRLMMTGKKGVGQIVKAPFTGRAFGDSYAARNRS